MNLKPVEYPSFILDEFAYIDKCCYDTCTMSWSSYKDPYWYDYTKNILAIPASSCGSGLWLSMYYYFETYGHQNLQIPFNWMPSLRNLYKTLPHQEEIEQVVVGDRSRLMIVDSDLECYSPGLLVYSNIGGFMHSRQFEKVLDFSYRNNMMLLLDAAHGHYLNYEKYLDHPAMLGMVYSFFTTKVVPLGEGGLILTKNRRFYEYCKDFMMYDTPNFALPGFNLRTSEMVSQKMKYLMHNEKAKDFLLRSRLEICAAYAEVCEEKSVSYKIPETPFTSDEISSNGYKFIISQPDLDLQELATTPVFKPFNAHVCPATYPHLNPPEVATRLQALL